MAVNKDFFLKEKQLCDSEQIVFLGKGRSSGHDNNLVKVIQELAIYRNSFNLDLRFCFLGLEDDYQTELQREIENYDLNNEKVTFTSHVQHDQVPKLLNDVSIGLIPYENTPYNNQRFPIKAVEYAAARVTILATDIPIHKEILGVDFCYFYSPDVPGDLCRALTEIFDDSQDRQKKIQKAQEWAYEHTYLNRVNVVLNSLSGLS
jgi:glycosyltransferase involved in cell wall biosynthesis